MYPSFSEDRKELSNRAVIVERKNISIKRKRRFMLIFSKENLVAGFILARPLITKADLNMHRPFSGVYQCCIGKSTNSKLKIMSSSFKKPSPILDSILKISGGADHDLDEKQKMDKLVKTLLQNPIRQISVYGKV